VAVIRERDSDPRELAPRKPNGRNRFDLLLLGIDGEQAPARGTRNIGELRNQEGRRSRELVGFRNDGEKLG